MMVLFLKGQQGSPRADPDGKFRSPKDDSFPQCGHSLTIFVLAWRIAKLHPPPLSKRQNGHLALFLTSDSISVYHSCAGGLQSNKRVFRGYLCMV